MKQREVHEKLARLDEERQYLTKAGYADSAFGHDPTNEVAAASAASRAERLAEIEAERAALIPTDKPQLPAGVRATVQTERGSGMVGQNLNGLVTVLNDGDEEVVVTEIDAYAKPSALVGRVDIPQRGHVINPRSWRSWAFGLMAHHPRIGAAIRHEVGAIIYMASGATLEAEPASILIHSPFNR